MSYIYDFAIYMWFCRGLIPSCGSLCLTIKEGVQLTDRNKIYSTQIMTCPTQTKLGQYKQELGQQKQELGLHKQGLIQQQLYGKAKLRKKLEGLPKENIIRVVMTLYDASKEARRYLDFYAEPNSKNECEHFKHIIRQEFFPTRGLPKDPSFATCRKAISDFKKMKPLPYDLADLMLFYTETGCEHTMAFGDMWEILHRT